MTTIDRPDGPCPVSISAPARGRGPWPGVLMCMDGLGIRPQLHLIAQRLADEGYVVALPDLFYRVGPYPPVNAAQALAESPRVTLAPLLASTDNARATEDAGHVLRLLHEHPAVADGPMAVFGYCMGGAVALTVAGTQAAAIAAAASFHAGGLVVDSDTSPHLAMPAIAGRVYIAAADADPSYPPAMAGKVVETLMSAGVHHEHELFAGAAHGWTMADSPAYDANAAERHWDKLLRLLGESLHSSAP